MAPIHRILSKPLNRPYRTKQLDQTNPPYLNKDGNIDFEPGDIENPQNWSTARRATVTFTAVLLVLNATFASSSPSGVSQSISIQFGVSRVAAGLTITLFLLGYCAGPLVFAPLSEFYGRRWVFYITFTLYNAFNFLCAFAPNFGSLLVGRFLTGTFVSAPLSNAPGVMADLWDPIERGNAMAGFSTMVWIGPALGPVISGFLELKKDWQWSFYVLLMLGAFSELMLLTIPETHGPTILISKARRVRKLKIPGYGNVKAPAEEQDRSLVTVYKVALTRPWLILFDPISFFCAIYLAVVYMLLYMLFSIYPIVFQQKRGWNAGVGELPLLGTAVGACAGGLIVMFDTHRRARLVEKGKTRLEDMQPEDRLPLAMIGGIGFFISMFWLSWSAQYNSVHWIVPTIAGGFLSASMVLIFVAYLNYLVDVYLMYAASAIAANTIARSACGAAAPLFTNQMFSALGIGGGGSLIGGVGAVLAVIPFLFYKYGKQIRMKSKFAPTPSEGDEKRRENEEANPADYDIEDEERTVQLPHSASDSESAASGTSNTGAMSEEHRPQRQDGATDGGILNQMDIVTEKEKRNE